MFDQIGGFATGIAAFFAVLGLVVFVHEFGHYQVARWLKVRVDSFSIGFGPEILAWTSKSNVRWRISALPLGGYVKFAGDKDAASQADTSQATGNPASGLFQDQAVWVRAAVTAAGPAFNFIFAIAVFAVFFATLGETIQRPVVTRVLPDGAAAAAGMQDGDRILSIDARKIDDFAELQTIVMTSGGQPLQVVVQRGGAQVPMTITPRVVERPTPFGDMERQGLLGIETRYSRQTLEHVTYNPLTATGRAVEQTASIIGTQINFISALVRGSMSAGHLNGPLGIYQIAGKVTENSVESAGPDASAMKVAESVGMGLVRLAALLSIAVGFMNLLPLPVLDGGHLVFYAAEAIRGKPVPERIQAVSYQVGLVCILSLFVFATVQDLERAGLFRALKGIGVAG